MYSPLVLTQYMMIVLGLTGFIIVMLMFERIRADAASLVVLVMLGFTGIVSEQELFKGFSGDAVISVMASMILSNSMDRTGALNILAGRSLRACPADPGSDWGSCCSRSRPPSCSAAS